MYKAPHMQTRPSSALPWLIAAATLFAVEASAHAQPKQPAATPAPAAPAAPAPATEPPPPEPAKAENDKEDPRAVYISADFGFARPDLGAFSDNLAFDKTA